MRRFLLLYHTTEQTFSPGPKLACRNPNPTPAVGGRYDAPKLAQDEELRHIGLVRAREGLHQGITRHFAAISATAKVVGPLESRMEQAKISPL